MRLRRLGALRAARGATSSTAREHRSCCRCTISSISRRRSSIDTRRSCRWMRLRVRLRLSERKAESTRRREGLLIGGEEPQQLVLLARREQRGLGYRPPGARRRRASEGGHGGPFERPYLVPVAREYVRVAGTAGTRSTYGAAEALSARRVRTSQTTHQRRRRVVVRSLRTHWCSVQRSRT